MEVTFGVLAHVDAGKTTLSEKLLFLSGTLRNPGRVDDGNTLLDFAPVERRRGITVFSAQAEFLRNGRRYHLVDTPGHADFAPEMERTLDVLDCAVLVVSATAGIQPHTETIWELLREKKIPTLLFINKMDQPGADAERVVNELKTRLSSDVCLLDDGMSDEAVQCVASLDEEAMELYLAGELCGERLEKAVRREFLDSVFFPGSAVTGDGVERLLEGLDSFVETRYDNTGKFSGQVYKIMHDKNHKRWALLKILSGTLQVKAAVGEEKVNEVCFLSGGRLTPVKEAPAGALCAVAGLDSLKCGDGIGVAPLSKNAFLPLLEAEVVLPQDVSTRSVLEALRELEDEEPCLRVRYAERTDAVGVGVMGDVQLEVLAEVLRERFGLAVSFGKYRVLYQETICGSVRGYGHFEPLRHYAEVHLLLEEAPRGSGITFTSACSTDFLSKNWQNLIETHVFEKEHLGILAGAPLTDVKITLLSGRAHLKHTEGGDFRQATYRAIRQALFKAKSVLLEPVYDFEANVPANLSGRIMADVRKMSGDAEPPERDGERVVVRGTCPVSEMSKYMHSFSALTRGEGRIRLCSGGYVVCHNTEKAVGEIGYDRDADTENTPDSVFCSHGAGYNVPWNQAEDNMHLPL